MAEVTVYIEDELAERAQEVCDNLNYHSLASYLAELVYQDVRFQEKHNYGWGTDEEQEEEE